MNKQTKTEIIKIKKLRKDGTIDSGLIESMASVFESGGAIIIPVDCTYGLLVSPEFTERLLLNKDSSINFSEESVLLISNFKMADISAEIGKHEFDFLHRIWPGEINVSMKKKNENSAIIMRMPRNRYIHDFINKIGNPVLFIPASCIKKKIFRENEIIKTFTGTAHLIIIIKEFCKDHIPPSLADISDGCLKIIKEGRVQSEDIKSLYFLDGQAN